MLSPPSAQYSHLVEKISHFSGKFKNLKITNLRFLFRKKKYVFGNMVKIVKIIAKLQKKHTYTHLYNTRAINEKTTYTSNSFTINL